MCTGYVGSYGVLYGPVSYIQSISTWGLMEVLDLYWTYEAYRGTRKKLARLCYFRSQFTNNLPSNALKWGTICFFCSFCGGGIDRDTLITASQKITNAMKCLVCCCWIRKDSYTPGIRKHSTALLIFYNVKEDRKQYPPPPYSILT